MKSIVVAIVVAFVFSPTTNLAQNSQRLVSVKPQSGQFVKTAQGYMVPYKATIPGTEVTFELTPVPGDEKNGIQPFWIGKHEVTMKEYFEFMKLYSVFWEMANQRIESYVAGDPVELDAITAPTPVYDPSLHFEFTGGEQYPAVSMSLFAARQYTKWLSLISAKQFRLPTEQEWAHACNAGSKTKWSFGDDAQHAEPFCVFDQDGPLAVGSKKPNAWGVHDMHGNVAEWVLNRKSLKDHRTFKDWDEAAALQKFKNMILKGGSWSQSLNDCQTSARKIGHADFWMHDPDWPQSPCWICCDECTSIGFRLMSPLKKQSRDDIEKYWGADYPELVQDVRTQVESGRGVLGIANEKLPATVKRLFDPNEFVPQRPPWDWN